MSPILIENPNGLRAVRGYGEFVDSLRKIFGFPSVRATESPEPIID
jgi:hypothetical protein